MTDTSNVFLNRVETADAISITFKPYASYSTLIALIIGIILLLIHQTTFVLIVFCFILANGLLYRILCKDVLNEIRVAQKDGSISVSGSRWSLNNPQIIVIPKGTKAKEFYNNGQNTDKVKEAENIKINDTSDKVEMVEIIDNASSQNADNNTVEPTISVENTADNSDTTNKDILTEKQQKPFAVRLILDICIGLFGLLTFFFLSTLISGAFNHAEGGSLLILFIIAAINGGLTYLFIRLRKGKPKDSSDTN